MKWTTSFAAALCAALATSAASAAVVTSVASNSTTGVAGITSWPNPYTVASVANPSQFAVNENNYGGSSLYSLAQSFTATTSGQLSNVQITITGTAPVTFDVALYDALSYNTADPGTNPGAYTPGGNVSANLLAGGAAQTWTQFTQQGATAAVLNFALSGPDAVNVVAGKQYIFEISSTSNPNAMIWFRGGASPTYTGGSAFRQRSLLNGALRDFGLAATIVPVPEPSCIVLAGLGALALLRRRK